MIHGSPQVVFLVQFPIRMMARTNDVEEIWEMEMPTNRIPALFLLLVEALAKKNSMRVEAVIVSVLTAFSCFMKQARVLPDNEPSIIWGLIIQPTSTGKVCM